MPSFYNFIEADSQDKFSAFFVLEAVTAYGVSHFKEDDGFINSENMEVKIEINGKEVDFEYVMGLVDEQLQDYRNKVYEDIREQVINNIEGELVDSVINTLGNHRSEG